MTAPTPLTRSRTAILIRQIVSLALSAVAIVLSLGILVLLIVRPSTFVSMGSYGLDSTLTALLESRSYLPLLPIAALMLLVGMPRRNEPFRPRRTAAMATAIVAAALCALTLLYPMVVSLLSAMMLFAGLIVFRMG